MAARVDENTMAARDPPSYDSGIPLSEAVAKTMMDKIEARSKWLDPGSRNTTLYGEAPPYMGKHQRTVLDVDGHRLPRDDPDIALSKRARCDTHATPPHKKVLGVSDVVFAERTDSAIIPAARVNSPCPREVGHRPPRDDSGRV